MQNAITDNVNLSLPISKYMIVLKLVYPSVIRYDNITEKMPLLHHPIFTKSLPLNLSILFVLNPIIYASEKTVKLNSNAPVKELRIRH